MTDMSKKKAAKVVSAAILGLDGQTVVVAGKAYHILPPTMRRPEPLCKALSCMIRGDESLSDELMDGTMEEMAEALETAYSLASVENFWKLSALARNVASLTAKQRL